MEYLAACPLCQGTRLSHYTSCKDYTVSHETFQLQQCAVCGFVFTNPRPESPNLSRYYQSDEYISHSNTSKQFLHRVYKIARSFTLKWKYQLITEHSATRPEKILDYGCGTGAFLEKCRQQGLQITGVEPAHGARSQAQTLTRTTIAANIADVEGSFNVITLWHVLEHIANLHETIEALAARLATNGTMFIAVPNLKSADAQHYQEQWAAFDVPRHLWHFSKETMQRIFDNHGLRIERVLPMKLDSYYVSLLSEKYKNQKQSPALIASALIQGWKSNKQAKKTGEYSSLIYIVRK